MPIVAKGVLTPKYLEILEEELGVKHLPSDVDLWLGISGLKIKFVLSLETADEATAILQVINDQLAQTEQATYLKKAGLWSKRPCPNAALLSLMLRENNSLRPRIKAFIDPNEFNLDQLKKEYGEKNLQAMCDVVNWCRELVNGENGRIKIEGNVTFGGTYAPQDLHTTNTSTGPANPDLAKAMADLQNNLANMPKPATPKRPTSPPTAANQNGEDEVNVPGDLVGRRGPDGKKRGGINIPGKKK